MNKLVKLISNKNRLIYIVSFILIIYCLYTHAYYPPTPFLNRGIYLFLSFILFLLMNYSSSENIINKVLFIISTVMCTFVCVYMIFCEGRIVENFYRACEMDYIMLLLYLIGAFLIMFRTQGGRVIGFLAILGFVYLRFGHYIKGIFVHNPFNSTQIATMLLTDIDKGAFGSLMGVVARILSIFFLFASLLIISGLGDLVNAMAIYFFGDKKGGPAKIAVITSALFGMVSGSPVANVAATGSFTIPLMKKLGYNSKTAAAVEAIASSGGGLVPPVMGLGAFIMCEIVGVPYTTVCLWGIIPAIMWYWTSYWIVDNSAYKQDVKLWKPEKAKTIKIIKEKFLLIFGIIVLIYFLVELQIAEVAAFWGVVSLLIISSIKKSTRIDCKKLGDLLINFSRSFVPICILISLLGIFISSLMSTGAHVKLGLLVLGGLDNWFFVSIIISLLCLVFGMIVPIVAAYMAVVLVASPILIGFGVPNSVVHMFVFYCCALAPITPPVALAVFTGSSISGSDPMETAFFASKIAFPLWLVPFILLRRELFFGMETPIIEVIIFSLLTM